MIEYCFTIHESLRALIEGKITKREFERVGKPCLLVSFETPITQGEFSVNHDDLVAFMGADVDYTKLDLVWAIFRDMIDTENYVENVFLPRVA